MYFAALPGAFERTITCNSLSKTYSITGWRLGYVQAAPQVIAQARKVHDFLTVGAAAPLQEAAIAGLELPDSYYAGLRELYTGKRDLFIGLLGKTGLPFTEPQGAYYVMLDISSWCRRCSNIFSLITRMRSCGPVRFKSILLMTTFKGGLPSLRLQMARYALP